jgi:hypothetical protein
VLRSFLQPSGLVFADALSEQRIEHAFADEGITFGSPDADDVVDTPAVTRWAFLSQMLFTGAQRSCVAAVARVIALLRELQVDVVVRLHQLREADFRRGERLGKGDHLVEWPRPAKPGWMDDGTYERMPATLRIREVEVQVEEPGFRTQSLVVVTTLTDAREYPREELADLYRQRWLVELDIRSIKSLLSLDVLRCKTPRLVHKELRTG